MTDSNKKLEKKVGITKQILHKLVLKVNEKRAEKKEIQNHQIPKAK